jgi:hypothetical protein
MPDNIVVTLRTEKPGGVWPFVRGCFAWVGFLVVVAGVSAGVSEHPQQKAAQIIEALRKGYEAARHANANPFDDLDFGTAPDDDPPNTEPPH